MQMSTALTNLLNVLGLILLGLVNSLLVKLRFNKASYPGSEPSVFCPQLHSAAAPLERVGTTCATT